MKCQLFIHPIYQFFSIDSHDVIYFLTNLSILKIDRSHFENSKNRNPKVVQICHTTDKILKKAITKYILEMKSE